MCVRQCSKEEEGKANGIGGTESSNDTGIRNKDDTQIMLKGKIGVLQA
jgi:hypothetical protein